MIKNQQFMKSKQMKKQYLILFFIFLNFSNLGYSQNYLEYIKKVNKYQARAKLKKHKQYKIFQIYRSSNDIRYYIDKNTFNIDEYIKMFNLLKFKDSTKNCCFYCFYVYDYEDGGYPRIIVKEKDIDYQNKVDKFNDGKREKDFYYITDKSSPECSFIPEDSYMGYLQYLYFEKVCDKFLLKYSALYEKKYVITSKYEAKKIIRKDFIGSDYEKQNKAQKANNFDFTPKIRFTDDGHCEIEWIEMQKLGIYRCKYKISRTDFNIKQTNKEMLLKKF